MLSSQIHYNNQFEQNGETSPLYVGQTARTEDINRRIDARYFPDAVLPPNFSPRPSSTKFCVFPVVDIRKHSENAISIAPDETNGKVVYNTGTARGPPITALGLVDIETNLRGWGRGGKIPPPPLPLTQNTGNNVAPVANREYETASNSKEGEMPPYLFSSASEYKTRVPEGLASIGNLTFHNYTKTQLRCGGDGTPPPPQI